VLQKLRQFQELGHQVIFLIGDFTGMIGDPTGKTETRPPLTREEIEINAETYKTQVFKILDPEQTEIRFNSEWMSEMSGADMVELAGKYTVARMLERDDFKQRFREGRSISIHEFLYPLVQGHDSVALEADVELGGTDQLFNLLVGRQLQRDAGQSPQIVLTTPLLEGTDGKEVDGEIVGQKMSKSLGNYIGINEPPGEIFGKIMSISDELMWRYYELLSDRSRAEIAELEAGHAMAAKKALGEEVTARYHDEEAARAAREAWDAQFSRGEVPDDMPRFSLPADADRGTLWIGYALQQANLAQSTSEAIRLVKGGGVKLDDVVVEEKDTQLEPGNTYVVRVGKRRWAEIEVVDPG